MSLKQRLALWLAPELGPPMQDQATPADDRIRQQLLLEHHELKSADLLGAVGPRDYGKPLWSEWDFEAIANKGFKRSTWVYIAIHKIAMSIGAFEWKVERQSATDPNIWEPAPDSPLQALLDNPNPHWTIANFMYRWVVSLYLDGNAFTVKSMFAGTVTELWLMNPARVRPIPNKKKYLEGYEISNAAGKLEKIVKPSEMIHHQFVDPTNPYRGMAPIMAAAKAVETEIEAQNWQKNSYENRFVPDGVLSYKHYLTREQWEDARRQARESSGNSLMILGADASFQQLSLTPVEMDFIETRKFSREEILAVHGVPPPTVGLYENATLANVETARKIFWLDTMIPLADGIEDEFNRELAPVFGPGYRIVRDDSKIEPMFSIFMEKLVAAKDLQALGYSLNEINRRLGLGMSESPSGNISWIPAGLMPAGVYGVDTLDDE